jgi:small subunit ribosomal protein S20
LPTTKTAEKEMRVAERRKARNKSALTMTKTRVTQAEKAIASGDIETAKTEVKNAVKSLDRESEKGKVHPNNAARRKSRLVKKLNKALAAAKTAAPAEAPKARTRKKKE